MMSQSKSYKIETYTKYYNFYIVVYPYYIVDNLLLEVANGNFQEI